MYRDPSVEILDYIGSMNSLAGHVLLTCSVLFFLRGCGRDGPFRRFHFMGLTEKMVPFMGLTEETVLFNGSI